MSLTSCCEIIYMLYKTAFTHSSDGFRGISITNMQRKRIRNLEMNVNGKK